MYCCCVAIPPTPDKPTIKKNGTNIIIIIVHPPSPGNVSVAVQCFVKYHVKGDAEWKHLVVSNCASVTITTLIPGSCYSFMLWVVYVGHESGSGSDSVDSCVEIRKFHLIVSLDTFSTLSLKVSVVGLVVVSFQGWLSLMWHVPCILSACCTRLNALKVFKFSTNQSIFICIR